MFVISDGATPLGSNETEGLKFKHITTRGELDELEQANITQGLQWLDRRRNGDILTDGFVRALHRRLFGDVWTWAGTYRLREMSIGIDPLQISVQLYQLLGNAQHWAKQATYDPLEAAGRFHHRMVQIHPFPNGHGRHARILADVYLEEYFKHAPIEWASGSDLQADNDRRTAYISSLRSADAGNFEPLLTFVGAR